MTICCFGCVADGVYFDELSRSSRLIADFGTERTMNGFANFVHSALKPALYQS